MAELDQDPSANTGRFRAFAENVERESADGGRPNSRNLKIAAGVVLAVVVIIILATTL